MQYITYQSLIDEVKTFFKTNCVNISNYNSIPDCYKEGFSKLLWNYSFVGSGNRPGTKRCTATLTINNPVPRVNTETVDTNLQQFLTSIGLSDTSTMIDSTNLLNFLQNLVVFFTSKTGFAMGLNNAPNACDSKIYVYIPTNPIKGTTKTLTESKPDDCIANVPQVKTITSTLVDTILQGVSIYPIKYNFTITES